MSLYHGIDSGKGAHVSLVLRRDCFPKLQLTLNIVGACSRLRHSTTHHQGTHQETLQVTDGIDTTDFAY